MWASVQNSITSTGDDPIGAANAGLDKVLGPSFDYLQQIKSPAEKGVSSAGTMDQVFTNTGAITGYVNNLLLGPKLGNQMFSDTGGTCRLPGTIDAKTKLDNKDGTIVNRWSWVNNKLGADDAAGILGPSFKRAVGGSGIDGIVPGMGGDIASMNPLKIMNALVLDASPPCQAYTCPVTLANGVPSGTETRFLSPSLELNMTGCVPASDSEFKKALADDIARKKTVTGRKGESFAPYFPSSYSPNVLVNTDPTPAITLGVAVALFLGYVLLRIH